MWFLTNAKTNKIHFLKKDKTSIGRVGCDIVLEGDASISRVHAHLMAKNDELLLQDAKSKYGTFVTDTNSQQVGDQPIKLKNGDTIGFGKLQNNWIVQHIVHKTATSMLAHDTRAKIKKILDNLKVELAENFDSTCSHLTMNPQTMVSHKLLHALALCKPIVTPPFWIAYKESIEHDQALPKSFNFQPQIREDSLGSSNTFSLAPNEARKKLFAGKTFLFLSTSQMNDNVDVVRSAGGKVTSLTQVKVTVKECCAKNSIVVQAKAAETQSQNESHALKIKAALAEKKRRVIPNNEIGLALMHCSIEQWCNPDFLLASLLLDNQSAQLTIAKSSKAIAAGTDSMGFVAPGPSTSRSRTRAKKATELIIATITSDSDDEMDGLNKENVPRTKPGSVDIVPTETQISLPQTQETQCGVSIQNVSLPPTQIPVDTQLSIAETQDSYVTASDFNKRSLRSGSSSTQVENSHSSVEVSSTPMSSSNLFNFTDTSISRTRQQRKRKISDNVETTIVLPVMTKKTKKQVTANHTAEPKQSKKKQVINVDSSDEETKQSKSTRKRSAAEALGNDGGLFNFNTNFIKKTKSIEDASQLEPNRETGIVPLTKFTQPTTATTFKSLKNDSHDSIDSGVWLSKKMSSFNLRDSVVSSVKDEAQEPFDSSAMENSEDIKPQLLVTLFDVLETTAHNSTTSSMVSKRKSFVKKQNFRPQCSVVTTKLMLVEETHKQHDKF